MRTTQFQSWSIFFACILAIAAGMTVLGRFEPVTQFDTQSYRDFPWANWQEALNHQRTFGYPAFLELLELLNGSIAIVPFTQFAISVLACSVWMSVLFRCGWRAAHALAATLPIMTSTMVLNYSSHITPDCLAQAYGVFSVAFWMLFVWNVPGLWKYVGLAVFVFLAYQTKPSYLFLLGFIPVGGLIARWWLFREIRDWLWVSVKLATLSVMPFLAWCLYRYLIVGHFGLVSFGGYNAIGITGQLLSEPMIERISPDLRPLAESILETRGQFPNWETKYSYSTLESQYNPMVWQIAIPSAKRLFGEDSRIINLQMARISREIILQNPVGYSIWLGLAAKNALTGCIDLTIRNPLVVFAFGWLLIGYARTWMRVTLTDPNVSGSSKVKSLSREYQSMVWMPLGYAFCSLMLVILVEAPIARYCAPAAVFLPCFFCMLAADWWLSSSPSSRPGKKEEDFS